MSDFPQLHTKGISPIQTKGGRLRPPSVHTVSDREFLPQKPRSTDILAPHAMHPRNLLRLLALTVLGLTVSCAHGGSGLGSVLGPGTNAGYKTKDLAGAWTGVFTPIPPPSSNAPNGSAVDPYPFYMRFDVAGKPFEGADARGWDWSLAVAGTNSAVNKTGDVLVEMSGTNGVNAMRLVGVMEESRMVHTGTYTIQKHLSVIEEGTYVLTKSTGPGHFTNAAQLEGSWSGIGYRKTNGRFRDMLLDLDANGSIVGGELVGEHVFSLTGVNDGLFDLALGDSEVGRLDDVVVQSTDGSTQTLHFLLVTEDGSLLGGPGTDSVLGDGVVRLERVPAPPDGE